MIYYTLEKERELSMTTIQPITITANNETFLIEEVNKTTYRLTTVADGYFTHYASLDDALLMVGKFIKNVKKESTGNLI